MDYPNHLIYASAADIKARQQQRKHRQQQDLLARCDGMEVIEQNGELRAVIDIELYQALVKFLIEHSK